MSLWIFVGGSQHVPLGGLALEAEWGAPGSQPGQMDHPMGVALGPDGRVYVADTGNERIQIFTSDGRVLGNWPLGSGARPVALAVRADDAILVADYTGDQVLVVDQRGQVVQRWGGTGSAPGSFRGPSGLALTPRGAVIVVEFMGQRVQELDAEGHFLRFIDGGHPASAHVGKRQAAESSDDSRMTMGAALGNPHGLFVFPSDVAAAADGTLYVTNTHAYEVLVLEAGGALRRSWGAKGHGHGDWEVPVGISVDESGNVYVADSANFRVQALTPDGRPLLSSRASERWYRTTRRVYSPTDVAIGPDGRLFVADFAASKIQVFRLELERR